MVIVEDVRNDKLLDVSWFLWKVSKLNKLFVFN